MSWHEVWNRKGRVAANVSKPLGLIDLIAFDGFDIGGGCFDEANWLDYVTEIEANLNISAGNYVCEVGCGAGALLYIFYEHGVRITGVDYADTLVAVARGMMPDMMFFVGQANQLPYADEQFDVVFSHSVFQYFPYLDYAARVLQEMHRITKHGGLIAVLDIPDAAKQREAEAFRRGNMSSAEYERLYANHPHLYYDKDWFRRTLGFSGSIDIFDQKFPGYGNSGYRFNVKIVKD